MPVMPYCKISAVVFDLDGTLIPTRKADLITSCKCAAWLTLHGVPLDESRKCMDSFLSKFREMPSPEGIGSLSKLDQWRKLMMASFLPINFKGIDALYEFWKQERCRQLSLSPSLQNMLVRLRAKYRLLLLTNGPSVAQWEKINSIGLKKFMDSFVVSEDVGFSKPQKEIFDIVCDQLKVSPEECVMVGDKLDTDIDGGHNAHYGATVWINPYGRRRSVSCLHDSVVMPNCTIENILQLENVLNDL